MNIWIDVCAICIVCMCVHIFIYALCMHECMCICVYKYIPVSVYVCLCIISIYAYAYMYTLCVHVSLLNYSCSFDVLMFDTGVLVHCAVCVCVCVCVCITYDMLPYIKTCYLYECIRICISICIFVYHGCGYIMWYMYNLCTQTYYSCCSNGNTKK